MSDQIYFMAVSFEKNPNTSCAGYFLVQDCMSTVLFNVQITIKVRHYRKHRNICCTLRLERLWLVYSWFIAGPTLHILQ